MFRVIGHIVGLVCIASVLGLVSNGVRKHPLNIHRVHGLVERPGDRDPISDAVTPKPRPADFDRDPVSNDPETTVLSVAESKSSETAGTSVDLDMTLARLTVGELGYYEISAELAHAMLNDPRADQGLFLFVDARSDDDYAEGHIPGAVQMFPYYREDYMPGVLPYAQMADRVVVYCGGGECEDSVMACQQFLEEGLAFGKLLLFKGGWHDWTEADYPVEEGADG